MDALYYDVDTKNDEAIVIPRSNTKSYSTLERVHIHYLSPCCKIRVQIVAPATHFLSSYPYISPLFFTEVPQSRDKLTRSQAHISHQAMKEKIQNNQSDTHRHPLDQPFLRRWNLWPRIT